MKSGDSTMPRKILAAPESAGASSAVGHIAIGQIEINNVADSSMDAICKGTAAGLELLLNIVAMLIVLVALVHLANAILSLLPDMAGSAVTLQRMLGLIMAPVCWLMGVPWDQAGTAGSLMGIKTVLNELIAYLELAKLPADALDARSRLIMLYAMCGFANFGSLGIMIAGLSVLAPERRAERKDVGAALGRHHRQPGHLYAHQAACRDRLVPRHAHQPAHRRHDDAEHALHGDRRTGDVRQQVQNGVG